MTRRHATTVWLCLIVGFAGGGAAMGQGRTGPEGDAKAAPVTVRVNGAEHAVSGPYTHENLSVFLIHGAPADEVQMISLRQAVASRQVRIRESGSVGRIILDNVSRDPVYIQEGDRVYGGKQDRMFMSSVVIPPRSRGTVVPCVCIEESRWTRGSTFMVSRNAMVAPRVVRQAAKVAGDQSQVWSQVAKLKAKYQESLGTSRRTSSLNEALDSRAAAGAGRQYTKGVSEQVKGARQVVGFAFAVNGQIKEVNLYASRDLTGEVFNNMLQSYAFEAATDPIDLTPQDLSARQIAAFMSPPTGDPYDTRAIADGNELFVHAADGLMFCRTEYQNRAIHMQWMRAEPEIKLRDQEQPAPAPEAEAEPASPGEEYLRQSRLLNEGEATGEPHE